MSAYSQEREIALAAIRDAVKLCQNVRQELLHETGGRLQKPDRSPVTIADFGSQALLCRALAAAFPADPIIAEEDARQLLDPANRALKSAAVEQVRRILPEAAEADVIGWIGRGNQTKYCPRFWTIDPIDGTKGFLRGGQYAIALALVVDGEVALGMLACPAWSWPGQGGKYGGQIFAAEKGRGTVALPLNAASAGQAVRVSGVSQPAAATFCESFEEEHGSRETTAKIAAALGLAKPPIRVDSQVKYALLASGEAEIFLRFPRDRDYEEKIWDHAAGALVLAEAGGKVTGAAGAPLDFTRGRRLFVNRGIVATNGLLHAEVLAAIQM